MAKQANQWAEPDSIPGNSPLHPPGVPGLGAAGNTEGGQTPAELLERIPTMSDEEGAELDRQQRGMSPQDLQDAEEAVDSFDDSADDTDEDEDDSAGQTTGGAGRQVNWRGPTPLKGLEGAAQTTPATGSLQSAAASPTAEDAAGHVYLPGAPKNLQRYWLFKTRRRTAIVGATAASAFLIIMFLVFFSLLPFKILNIVNNLESRFFGTSQAALDKEVNALFTDYVKNYVLPGLYTCPRGSTIDKRCTPKKVQGNSLVSKLYKGWWNGHLEYALASNHGLEFQRRGNNFYMKLPGMNGNGIDLPQQFRDNHQSFDDFLKLSDSDQFSKVSRNQIRVAINDSLDKETFFRRTSKRFFVGRFMEKKYGIRRCIVFCKTRDNFDDWKGRKKDAAMAYIIDRMITPRNQTLSLVLRCVMAGSTGSGAAGDACPNVTSVDLPDDTCDPSSCAPGGEPEDKWHKDMRNQLDTYRGVLGNEEVDKLLARVDLIRKYGYWAYAYAYSAERIGKAFDDQAASDQKDANGEKIKPDIPKDASPEVREALAKAFSEKLATITFGGNIIGAVDTTSNIMANIGQLDKQLHKMTYLTNAATMVAAFGMYRTYADEIKTGNVDQGIVGSFTKTFNGGSQDQADHQVGGTAGAEQSKLYQTLIDRQPANKVLAQTNSEYHCGIPERAERNTDKPIPPGQIICPETNLGYNPVASDIGSVTHSQPLGGLIAVSQKWKDLRGKWFSGVLKPVLWTIDQLSNFITEWGAKFVGVLPGAKDTQRFVEKFFDFLMQWVSMNMVPSPTSGAVSGARIFDINAGGADVGGNDYAHYGIGGQRLTKQEIQATLDDQQQLDLARYHSQSFFARMFDANDPNSAAAKLALSMPGSTSESSHQALGFLTDNPFAKISHIFGSLYKFRLPSVMAAQTKKDQDACLAFGGPTSDCFDVSQYGYKEGDPVFNSNQDAYWTGRCVMPGHEGDADVSMDKTKQTYQWDSQATLNGSTYMPENDDTTDGCLLQQAAIGSAGYKYDPSTVGDDAQAD